MSHIPLVKVDIEQVVQAGNLKFSEKLIKLSIVFIVIGLFSFISGISGEKTLKETWGIYYINLLFFMGIALGGVMTTVIFQIVRAKWSASIRRVAEANISFLPVAFGLFLITYLGSDHLFPWATKPMPGREWWMQGDFVYFRFIVLFIGLFFFLKKFVNLSLRSDIGFLRDRENAQYLDSKYDYLVKNWQGIAKEVKSIQYTLSYMAPAAVLIYVLVYSLFSFEMIMGMDTVWFSNMFGGFNFIGNVYLGWATLASTVILLSWKFPEFAKNASTFQLWDLGKLTMGFCILWGYTFISQYLPQWYGNMPEETQWLILRTRGHWQPLAYITFATAFVVPLMLLISEDIKKNPKTFLGVCIIVFLGVWLEKYMVVMPSLTHHEVPIYHGILIELGIFLGFLGAYILAIASFFKKFPFVAISHPLTHGSVDW